MESAARIRRTSIPVLYIDDNKNEIFFLEQAVYRTKSNFTLICLNSVSQGMDYLVGNGSFSDRRKFPLPVFVLLDYFVGLHTGPELLRWMRARPELAEIPVAMYSDSDCTGTICRSYEAGANHFLVKPRSQQRLEEMVRSLEKCFSSLPPKFKGLLELPEYCRVPSVLAARQG